MPKKKNKKHASGGEKGNGAVEEDSAETENEVSDGKKYSRRQIQSNWDRYRPPSPKSEEEELNKSDDFAALMNAPADCNYFRFKSEKNWESEAENSSLGGHKFFNLDLELLSSGLSCIPFYERVSLGKSILSESHIERCDKNAEESMSRYKPIVERFMKKLESENELHCADEKEPKVVKVKEREKRTEPSECHTNLPQKNENNTQFMTKKDISKVAAEKIVKHVNEGEEDLEDWLDSVLDD